MGTDDLLIVHELLGKAVEVPFCYPCATATLTVRRGEPVVLPSAQ